MRSWLRYRHLSVFSVSILLSLLSVPAFAQSAYPARPLRVVVGFAPGGSNDIIARLFADKLSKAFGQTVIVENKPGAGGGLAAAFVKSQPADGYTLLVGASGAMVVGPAIGMPAQFDTLKDFEPVSVLGTFPLVLIVNAESQAKSTGDLVTWSKANAASANYASASPTFTLAAELFKMKTGAALQRVSYRGSNDAVLAVLGNQVAAAMIDPVPAIPLLKDGKIRALAVTSQSRLAELPQVPTMTEGGIVGADAIFWTGLFVPKSTPKEIVSRLEAESRAAMSDPAVVQRLQSLATEATSSTSAEFSERIKSDLTIWGDVAKKANVTVE